MKTIILCGGSGTRMKEETEFKPKPMVFIGNKPILWHIMKIYAQYGYNEFILALGYKANYIKDYFLNQKAFTSDFTLDTRNHDIIYHTDSCTEKDRFIITFVDTGLETLPGERILRCKKYIPKNDHNFMVTYGDGVADINIKSLVKYHLQHNLIGTITGIHPRSKFGSIITDHQNRVEEFSEKPVLNDWINGGFMVFSREFFKYLRTGELEHKALKRIAKQQELSLYPHTGFWKCMDTYKEMEELTELWQNNQAPWKIWK